MGLSWISCCLDLDFNYQGVVFASGLCLVPISIVGTVVSHLACNVCLRSVQYDFGLVFVVWYHVFVVFDVVCLVFCVLCIMFCISNAVRPMLARCMCFGLERDNGDLLQPCAGRRRCRSRAVGPVCLVHRRTGGAPAAAAAAFATSA